MNEKLQLPRRTPKRSLSVIIEADLYERAKATAKKRSITLKQAVEFGLKKFIEADENEK